MMEYSCSSHPIMTSQTQVPKKTKVPETINTSPTIPGTMPHTTHAPMHHPCTGCPRPLFDRHSTDTHPDYTSLLLLLVIFSFFNINFFLFFYFYVFSVFFSFSISLLRFIHCLYIVSSLSNPIVFLGKGSK